MSGVALQAAIVSALQGIITAFDAPPVRAALWRPYRRMRLMAEMRA